MSRRVRRLLLLMAATALIAVPASAVAHPTTIATIFRAFHRDGTPTLQAHMKSGTCFTGSLTIDRRDAWRCIVGNFLYDPCFSSAHAPGKVLCPDAGLNRAVEIKLTKGLPRAMANTRAPSLNDQPWNIQLTSGRHCELSNGATIVVQGVPLNYFCGASVKFGLWGFPRRKPQPWTILSAPFSAKHLHTRAAIHHVWM